MCPPDDEGINTVVTYYGAEKRRAIAHAVPKLGIWTLSADQADAGPQTKETTITTATTMTMVAAIIILLVGTSLGISMINTCARRTY